MDAKLRQLFDFQRFQNNARLAAIIADTHARCGSALEDDQLEFVSAAGDAAAKQRLQEGLAYDDEQE